MPLRLPGLLNSSLSEAARLSPTAGSLTLKMYGSSEATLTLPEQEAEEKGVRIRDWISIYTEEGLAGVFRVTNVSQPLKKQVDLTLLHGIDILSDSVWGEQTDFEGTKQEFLTRLLAQQTQLINGVRPWVLGTCEDTATVKRSINYDRLNTLLEGLIEEGSDFYFTYDQSVFPWRLNYVRIDNQVMSEFRLTRNIRSATITYNDADLCTRLFLTVSSETEEVVPTKKLNPAWVSDTATPSVPRIITENVTVSSVDSRIKMYENTAAQARWGIVVKTADIDTQDDIVNGHFESADAWAASFLARRSAPSVQIQVDGDDLSDLTGEPWDRARLARLCQVALPAYGETFRERVLSITWPELFKRPTHITLSLANTLPRFTESLAAAQTEAASASRSSRATARAQTKDEKEITTWSQHVQWQGAALDGSGIMTLYESGIDLDATGGARIYSLENGLQGLYGELIVQSQRIDAKVGSDALQGLLHIDQLSTELGNVMTGSNGESIAATIVTKINNNQGTIYLNSDHVKLKDGSIITASTLDARLADIDALFTSNGYSKTIVTNTMTVKASMTSPTISADNFYFRNENGGLGDKMGTKQVQFFKGGAYQAIKPVGIGNDTVMNLRHSHEITITELTGDNAGHFQVTLGEAVATNSTDRIKNFKIADTAYYKSRVGISSLVVDATDQAGYNDSTADAVTVAADGYYIIVATPKDGVKVSKKFHVPAGSAAAQKVSKGSWSGGQILISPSTAATDPVSANIKLVSGTYTGTLDSASNPSKITFDILEDLGNNQTADTFADVVATVTRQAATLKLGTNSDNEPAIVANTVGRATVGGQVIQVGVTALKVTPGTATPGKSWNSRTNQYDLTATGSVSIGSDSLALTQGTDSFTPSDAFTHGFNLCFNSVSLSASKTTLNPGESVDVIPNMKGTWDASAAQAFSGKKLTITAAQAATVTPKVSKKTWSSSGTLTFEASTASGDPTSAGVALGWITVPNTSNGNASLSVVDKASPYSSAQPHTVLTKDLTLTCEDDAAYLKDGGTTLAKVPNNKTAAPVTVNVEKGSWSSGEIQFTTNPASGTGKNVSLGMTIPANTSNGNAQITIVDKASPGSSSQPLSTGLTKTLTLTCEDDAAYLKDGNTTVAKVPNNKTTPTVSASIDNITGSAIDDTNTRETVPISASGTNVTSRTEYAVLKRDTYGSAGNKCVTLTMDGVVIGRISAQTFYTEGRNSVKITNVERVASCAIDDDAQTAEQDVRFTLSNGETYTIHEDFSDVYRAGRNGTAIDAFVDYAVDLSSGGVVFDPGVEEDADGDPLRIDLSDIYQAGRNYTPPVLNWYIYQTTSSNQVDIYVWATVLSSNTGVMGKSKKVAFYPYTPVELTGDTKSYQGITYTQVSYGGTNYYVLPNNLKQFDYDISEGHRIGIKDIETSVYPVSSTMTGLIHTGGATSGISVYLEPYSGTAKNYTSSYVTSADFSSYRANGSASDYFSEMANKAGYYGRHEQTAYSGDIQHKAIFEILYSDETTETVVVSFNSYAKAADEVVYTYTGYIDANNYVNLRSDSTTAGTVLAQVPDRSAVKCQYNPNGYTGTWMPVQYGGKTGYIQSKFIEGTKDWNDLNTKTISTITLVGVAHAMGSSKKDITVTLRPQKNGMKFATSYATESNEYTYDWAVTNTDTDTYLLHPISGCYMYHSKSAYSSTMRMRVKLNVTYTNSSKFPPETVVLQVDSIAK